MAFICRDIQEEKEKLKDCDTTNIERFHIGNQYLDIFFARGPSGEIVELIEKPKLKDSCKRLVKGGID